MKKQTLFGAAAVVAVSGFVLFQAHQLGLVSLPLLPEAEGPVAPHVGTGEPLDNAGTASVFVDVIQDADMPQSVTSSEDILPTGSVINVVEEEKEEAVPAPAAPVATVSAPAPQIVMVETRSHGAELAARLALLVSAVNARVGNTDRLIDDTILWAEGVGDDGLISRLEDLRAALDVKLEAVADEAAISGWFDRWVSVKKISATGPAQNEVTQALNDLMGYFSRHYGTLPRHDMAMPQKEVM